MSATCGEKRSYKLIKREGAHIERPFFVGGPLLCRKSLAEQEGKIQGMYEDILFSVKSVEFFFFGTDLP